MTPQDVWAGAVVVGLIVGSLVLALYTIWTLTMGC